MIENLKLNEGTFKRESGKISFNNVSFSLEEGRFIMNWLRDAIKPRYKINVVEPKGKSLFVSIIDTQLDKMVVRFYQVEDFDYINKAEQYCKSLNKNNDQ